jgi:hypothetical protein
MGAAQQPDPAWVVLAGLRESVDVIELERAGFGAPVAAVVDERAAALVALVDCALHRIRNVA